MIQLFKKLVANILIFTPTVALATIGGSPGGAGGIENPLKFDSITKLLEAILEIVILIGVPVLVMAVIWVGFMFVKAQGDPAELKTARSAFFWTVIGAGVVLGAKVISLAIQETITNLGK